jgi:hypothetical protein
MDAADEAGGETIFSSDGMDPLPIPTVPVREENVYEVLETDAPLVSTTPSRESPQERLQRLTKEVTALQQELKDNEQVSKLARELSSRLEVSSSISALERSIHQRGSEQTREDATRVVPRESTGNNVEERLVQLERLVGASTCTTSASILARIEKVENLANRIDEKALEEAATRAKVIRYVPQYIILCTVFGLYLCMLMLLLNCILHCRTAHPEPTWKRPARLEPSLVVQPFPPMTQRPYPNFIPN